MSRKTLKRLAELALLPNVWDAGKLARAGGMEACCGRNRSLVLELGCGRGEYTVALASRQPETQHIGVDVKGARLHRGATAALELALPNVAFLHAPVQNLADLMGEIRAREIWLLFPDPFPKPSKANRRLTSPSFLEIYRRILEPDGCVHLKTDHAPLFEYTIERVSAIGGRVHTRFDPLPALDDGDDPVHLQTTYERRWRAEGRIIRYACFTLAPE